MAWWQTEIGPPLSRKTRTVALLLLASALGSFLGHEVNYAKNNHFSTFWAEESVGEVVFHLILTPLVLPALLLTPGSALVALATAIAAWRLRERRLLASLVVAAVGFGLASYLSGQAWRTG